MYQPKIVQKLNTIESHTNYKTKSSTLIINQCLCIPSLTHLQNPSLLKRQKPRFLHLSDSLLIILAKERIYRNCTSQAMLSLIKSFFNSQDTLKNQWSRQDLKIIESDLSLSIIILKILLLWSTSQKSQTVELLKEFFLSDKQL